MGEWLTRRILRSFSGLEEELQAPAGPSLDRTPLDSWGLPQSSASRRDTEAMLAQVSRTENESSDTYRRIEEQLRSVGRRLDSAERSQSENNRVMTKTASEINIATREQAQAFDQLGGHVMGLADRIERLEHLQANDGLKEAVKALHQGLSRLADQITQTSSQSASQVSALAGNIEQLAARLGQLRADSEAQGNVLEQRIAAVEKVSQINYNALDHVRADSEEADRSLGLRIADVQNDLERLSHDHAGALERVRSESEAASGTLDQRLGNVEKGLQAGMNALDRTRSEHQASVSTLEQRLGSAEQNLQAGANSLDRTRSEHLASLSALEQRLDSVEKASQLNANALDHVTEKLDSHAGSRAGDLADAQKQKTSTEVAIMRLEENLGRLEQRGHDPIIDRRLDGFDRSLAELAAKTERNAVEPLEETVQALARRLDALDKKHTDLVTELQALPEPAAPQPPPFEAEKNFATPPFQPQPPSFDAPAFDVPPLAEHPANAAPGFHQENFESNAFTPGFDAADPFSGGFAPDDFAGSPPLFETQDHETESHFAAESDAGPENFLSAARRSAQAAAHNETLRSRAGLNWGASDAADSDEEKPRSRLLVPLAIALVVALALAAALVLNQRMNSRPRLVLPPKPVTQAVVPPPALPVTSAPQSATAAKPVVPAPAPQPTLPAAAAKPAPASRLPAPQPAIGALAAGDRIVQLANAGNPIAETVLGLKYLDGDGVPADPAQAGKWLSKAADQGQAVAQYRLGTMYERGQGTAADGAKAAKWYLASANQGNRKAMHNLAVAYADGAAGKKDMGEAARWFAKAASLGLADSQFNLAVLYERGDGVPQSLTDAYKWYAIAAAAGDSESKQRLSVLQTQLSDADRAAAQKAASAFHAAPLSRAANVPPEVGDLPAH